MHTHTPQEIAEKTPKAFRGEDDALYVEALKSSMPMFSPDGVMDAEGAEAVRTLLAGSMEKVRSADHRSVENLYQRIHSWTLKHFCSSASPDVLVLYAVTLFRGGFVMPTALQIGDRLRHRLSSTRSASGRSRPRPPSTSCGSMVPVKLIPGTLNVGHTLPTIAQAFIYTQLVPVESTTLVLMIVAAVTGSWLGAGVVVHWPRRKIQIGMGLALLGAAALMLMTALQAVSRAAAIRSASPARGSASGWPATSCSAR